MKFELIDIHAHVNFNAFKDDADKVIEASLRERVGMILVGSQFDTSKRAVEMAEKQTEGLWAAVGLHPIHLSEVHVDEKEIGATGVPGFSSRPEKYSHDRYGALAAHKRVVAIGECGMDYFRVQDQAQARKVQKETFAEQIALAKSVGKPLIVHCRNAYGDLLEVLRSEHAEVVGGTIHFFAGTWEIARQFLEFGFHLSFTGVITFAHDYDEVIKNMPLDRIMVETDSPYVAPVPYRGKRNEPRFVREVARRVAEIRNVDLETIMAITTENATKLFKL